MPFIEDIRAFEAAEGLKPADIEVLPSGAIKVTIDKSVLYQYNPQPKSGFQRFWSWLNDSDNSFNPVEHARYIEQQLNENSSDQQPITVTTRRRYKQLPIPYFSIPIPIENAGTQVRDYSNLAVQKIKVSMTFPKDYNSKIAIKKLTKAAVISHTLAGSPTLPSAGRRPSWNPIKWVLHGLAELIPDSWAKKMNKILPNKWIKATRPYEWGKFCDFEINHGFINSGLAASAVNLGVIFPLTGGTGNLICTPGEQGAHICGSQEIIYGREDRHESNSNGYGYYTHRNIIHPEETNRFTLFMQTRAKLNPKYCYDEYSDDHERKSIDSEVDNAIRCAIS